ncbi:hypothetical protein GF373_08675, partial [bacterium]|nr:hypothetical protein [bacterium]
IEGISFVYLTGNDIVRHPLVQKIVEAYEGQELTKTAVETQPPGESVDAE